ncbi:hypothetical protein ACNKHL_01455 [Shigella flexneri]
MYSVVRREDACERERPRCRGRKNIATTFESQGLAPTLENVCSVLAVARRESIGGIRPFRAERNRLARIQP